MSWYSLPTTSHLLYVLCYCFLHLHHHLFFTLIIVLLITTSTTTTNFTIMTFWPQVISTTSSSSSRVRLRPGRLLRVDHWHNQLPHAQSPRRHSRRWNPPSTVKIQPNYQISLSTTTPKRWKWSQSQCTPRCLAEISMMLSSFMSARPSFIYVYNFSCLHDQILFGNKRGAEIYLCFGLEDLCGWWWLIWVRRPTFPPSGTTW